MKLYYVFYRVGKAWVRHTSCMANSANDAIAQNRRSLERMTDSGIFRAFRKNRLPWEGR